MEFFWAGANGRTPPITDLDTLYYNRNSTDFLRAFRTFPILFNLTQRQLEKQVIDDLGNGSTGIHRELYKAYSENLRKAVGDMLGGDKYSDLQAQLQANVSRFAAYKAYHATQQMQKQRTGKDGAARTEEEYRKNAKIVFDTFNRYQVAEYNTATARARTAKQWVDFTADTLSNELYPNLKWLPSRSADPREEHRVFWGLVFPKNHPFWRENQPGNLWNCKCDWEETDEQPFGGKAPATVQARGLEGNPGETGEIFTDNTTYISSAPRKAEGFFRTEYRESLIDKNTFNNDLKEFSNLELGKMKNSNFAYENIVKHAFNEKEFAAVDYLPNDIRNLKNPKFSALGEVKDMTNPKAIKNIDKKKKRGVRGYYAYKWIFGGKEWIIKTENIKNHYEQLYSIAPVK